MAEHDDAPPLGADTVDNLTRLAALSVAAEERPRLAAELGRIVALINVMRRVDTSGVAPLAHPVEVTQPLRADRVTEAVDRQSLQARAPAVRDGLYLVPRVVE